MENFVVSARKYRPQRFSDVVGQSAITDTLENAIKNNHLAQAFLFCGPRGVGKTTCARILAKVINSPEGKEIDPNEDFSFNIFELDAASNNSVDDIRSLTDQVRIPPQAGQYKVYIIDEAHMLSQSAFNAFLKTLEEPPPHAIFILATTEKHKIIPTILSRCQIFDFKRIEIKDMERHLAAIAAEEGVEAESDALHLIAEKADGALRDALSIFDQIISFSGNKLTYKSVVENLNILDYDYFFRAVDAIRKHDIPSALVLFDEILNKGFDGHHFINGLGSHYRNLLVSKDESTLTLLQVGDSIRAKYLEQSKKVSQNELLLGLKVIARADVDYKSSKNQRLLVEIALLQLCSIGAEDEKKKTDSERINILPPGAVIKHSQPQTPESPPKAVRSAEKEEQKASPTIQVEEVKKPLPAKETHEVKFNEIAEPAPEIEAEIPDANKRVAVKQETQLSETMPKVPVQKEVNTISIGAMLADAIQEEVEEEEDLSSKPREEFDFESLMKVWTQLAKEAQEEGKRSFSVMLSKYDPEINGENIVITLDNSAQVTEFNYHKQGFLDALRSSLNHYGINLEYSLEVKKEKRKLYTNREKFEHMLTLNPSLREMQKELGLDPDF